MGSFRGSLLLAGLVTVAAGQPGKVETVLAALTYGGGCWSAVELQNLGAEPVTVDVEAHRESGGLVGLVGRSGMAVRLDAGERGQYRLQIPEETANAWVRVIEPVPSAERGPVIAVTGVTECLAGDQLIDSVREAAFPMRDPWFSGEVAELKNGLISLTNTSARPATASVCYSSGSLYSVPSEGHAGSELKPVCSEAFDVQIPPFAAREWPLERQATTHFAIRTRGAAIALQMLRPLQAGVKVYSVDSTIRFGGEAPGAGPRE